MQSQNNRIHSYPIEYVIIGRITKAHGLQGEICVSPMTDNPKRFKLLKTVFIGNGDSERTPATVEKVRIRDRDIKLKLENINTRDQAEKLRGVFIEIPRDECLPLKDDEFYLFELIGLEVRSLADEYIGIIEDIIDYPANDVFVVKTESHEFLIPVIDDVVKTIDVKRGLVVIDPLDGLLD